MIWKGFLSLKTYPFEKQSTNKIHVKKFDLHCAHKKHVASQLKIFRSVSTQYNSVGRNFGRLKIAIGISEFALPLVPLKIHDPSGHLKHSKSPRC